MTPDIPDAADLLATAREALLSEVLPALSDERRYVARMIANALAIATREHQLGADATHREIAVWRQLVDATDVPIASPAGADAAGELSGLRRAVCGAIRAGRFDEPARAGMLAAALLRTVRDQLANSNPTALQGASARAAHAR
jgi:hypothetical protein